MNYYQLFFLFNSISAPKYRSDQFMQPTIVTNVMQGKVESVPMEF